MPKADVTIMAGTLVANADTAQATLGAKDTQLVPRKHPEGRCCVFSRSLAWRWGER
jgi:hypothetical protein